jgi:hypothetical protein
MMANRCAQMESFATAKTEWAAVYTGYQDNDGSQVICIGRHTLYNKMSE